MKKIVIAGVNEIIYYEKLSNGLEIYMLPKETVNNVYATFTTKYGSIHNEFVPNGKSKMVKMPNGIAHFLEHKMFERESGVDPMIFYASKGADVNAFTTRRNTSYEFYGPDYLEENLEYLIDYVQTPYFTDENVEKEKGIIEQEINMDKDNPYSEISDGVFFNAFKKHPIKYSIPGEVKDIYRVTKENLYDCYHTFYHPSNMFLVITGNFNPEKVVELVKKNQEKKEFDKFKPIELKKVSEPEEVAKSYEEKKMNVVIPKLSYGIKLPLANITLKGKKRTVYINLLLDILFGQTSLFYERMKELKYVDSSFEISSIYADDYSLILIECDTKKDQELIKEIKEYLSKIKIDDKEFERKKKSAISSQIYLYENIRYINTYILHNVILYGNVESNMVQLLKELNKKELDKLISELNINNTSIFVIKPIK
jgi:predicted Zn-dependent peptidase